MSKTKKMRKLCKAAKMGVPHAMYALGIKYQLGQKCEKNMNEAAKWISSAAEAEYAPAIEWMKDYSFDDDAAVQAEA